MNMTNEIIAVAIVSITVLAVMWLGKQRRKWIRTILNWFPAILFAYAIPALFTHVFSLDLKTVFIHSLSKDWIIPFAILAVMSALRFKQLKIVGARPILLFVVGSFFIAVLPVFLVYIFSLVDPYSQQLFIEDQYWKGLVPIVGGWIGGSTSQLVLKELVGTDEALFLSILVLDNVLVNIWTILMFQFIKRSDALNRFFRISDNIKLLSEDQGQHRKLLTPLNCMLIIILIIIGANLLEMSFLWKVIGLSVIGLALGNLVKNWNVKFVLMMGSISIILIMAILGLKLDFSKLSLPIILVALVIVWLLGHYIIMIGTAVLLRLNIAWVPIASMANLGGISTAPAVTSAYRKELMPHAILLAILSMVSGTAWGILTIYLFETWF